MHFDLYATKFICSLKHHQVFIFHTQNTIALLPQTITTLNSNTAIVQCCELSAVKLQLHVFAVFWQVSARVCLQCFYRRYLHTARAGRCPQSTSSPSLLAFSSPASSAYQACSVRLSASFFACLVAVLLFNIFLCF